MFLSEFFLTAAGRMALAPFLMKLQPKYIGCYMDTSEEGDVFIASMLKVFRVGYITTLRECMGLVSHMAMTIRK